MKQRVITAVIMGLILIPFLILGDWFIIGLITLLSYIAGYELLSMYQSKNQIPIICKYIIPLFSSMIVLTSAIGNMTDVVYVLLVEFMFLLIVPIFNKNIKTKDIIFFVFAIIYSGVTFTLMVQVRNLDAIYNGSIDYKLFGIFDIHTVGLVMTCYVLITTMFTDIFAYQFGVKFGKHKLCPTISPKKSIEGSIAGTVFGSVFGTALLVGFRYLLGSDSVLLFNIENVYLYTFAVFGISLLLSIAGQLGDLVASKLKREYEIKDFGKLFPGHGGVLDRFDSSIYTFLVFYVILMIIGVVL